MIQSRVIVFSFFVLAFFAPWAMGQDPAGTGPPIGTDDQNRPQPTAATSAPGSFDQVIERVVQRERFFVAQMRHLHPLVETYIQNLKGKDEKAVPVSDEYFLGRLNMSNGPEDISFKEQSKDRSVRRLFLPKLTNIFQMKFLPLGFAQMVLLDENFQRENYDFAFLRREFLGEIRCLVIDVQPKQKSAVGRFVGRIWVEDQNYNIVRFNGTYNSHRRNEHFLHFDTWRLNLRPGVWLPAYIYSEESHATDPDGRKLHFKAQTRFWGYALGRAGANQEFTEIVVDSAQGIKDQSAERQDASPFESEGQWEHEAEDNVIDRLQNMGLIAPPGEVDKVLQTVVNNLMVTNSLNIQPEVRVRVLLTAPLESFTVGHTIVVSRGLLDVLPDEASLAMVLAHELGHVALGHRVETDFAFGDRMLFPDENTFVRFNFRRTAADEEASDAKAIEFLSKSPYKEKLGNAGLFLEELQLQVAVLKNLIRPHLGNGLTNDKAVRMSALIKSAPKLEPEKLDQIAALPLGGRVKMDPWSDKIELAKAAPIVLTSASQKMPFEVTPLFPFLKRFSTADSTTGTSAVNTPGGVQ